MGRTGRRVAGRQFVLLATPSRGSHPRLGLTVSRRVGNAVTRNRVKRQVREWFRSARSGLGPLDLVVIARPRAAEVPSGSIHEELADLVSQLEAREERR